MRFTITALLVVSILSFSGWILGSDENVKAMSADTNNSAPSISRGLGDLIKTINGPVSPGKGVAHDGTHLLVIMDLKKEIYILDENTGKLIGSVPLNSYDMGLAYDTKRNLYVTTSVISGEVKIYDGVSPNPIYSFPAPNTGPMGAAYDPTRDVYWVADWKADELTAVDATTGALGTTYDLSQWGCTRSNGCAYDPKTDEIYVGSRDYAVIYVFDAATGLVVRDFVAMGSAPNDPGGLAVSPRQTLWQARGTSKELYELDAGYGPGKSFTADMGAISAATGGSVNLSLFAGAANANRKFLVFGSISGTSPGIPTPGGGSLPLKWDVFTNFVLANTNGAYFKNFLGKLDGSGNGVAIFDLISPLPSIMVGLSFFFAYPVKGSWFVSNSEEILITP